jgi:hypothetical protein
MGGTTDSFGPTLRPLMNGLRFLPFSNSPHFDGDQYRRPLFQQLVADGTLPNGYATDNDTGLVYVGTDLHEAITEREGALAYEVRCEGDDAVETALRKRLL